MLAVDQGRASVMRAYVLERYGDAECARLTSAPLPRPAPNEVLVRVAAAGLNPVDYKIRAGKLRPVTRFPLPVVLGNELSGTVTECGSDVRGFVPGDRVCARVAKERLGAFAEFAAVDVACAAKLPATLDFEHAAALPLAGLTALQCLRDEIKLTPGQHLLIAGGAGGVGTFAIPLAKHMGATVWTTASSAGSELVRRLGADHVIDYRSAWHAEHARRFDAVLDLVGGKELGALFGVLKAGRTLVSVGGVPEPQTARKDLNRGGWLAFLFWLASFRVRAAARRQGAGYRYLFMHPSGSELAELLDLVERGALPITLDRVFDFKDIAEAMAYLEQGRAKGKVVVSMDSAGP
ncbi:MAG: NADP-dependent oxidoreductase [Lysobacterales bacterium]